LENPFDYSIEDIVAAIEKFTGKSAIFDMKEIQMSHKKNKQDIQEFTRVVLKIDNPNLYLKNMLNRYFSTR